MNPAIPKELHPPGRRQSRFRARRSSRGSWSSATPAHCDCKRGASIEASADTARAHTPCWQCQAARRQPRRRPSSAPSRPRPICPKLTQISPAPALGVSGTPRPTSRWLPAAHATIPFCSCSELRCAILLCAPRRLNENVGCISCSTERRQFQ